MTLDHLPRISPVTRREAIQRTVGIAGLAAFSGFDTAEELKAAAQHSPQANPSGFKIGAVDWELTKAADPKALEVAARLGFDGVQVDLGDVQGFRDPVRQRQYLALARQHGIEIASLALGILNEVPYAQDPKAPGLVEAAIDIAQAMKQRIILLAFFGKGDLNRPENRLDSLIGRLKENAPKAEKAGVVLGLEAEISVERYRQILDKVGSPSVQVYFDLVHAHVAGRDIRQEIGSLAGQICEFHAKDYGNILFGLGRIDFPTVRRAMDEIGYRGWIHGAVGGDFRGEAARVR